MCAYVMQCTNPCFQVLRADFKACVLFHMLTFPEAKRNLRAGLWSYIPLVSLTFSAPQTLVRI